MKNMLLFAIMALPFFVYPENIKKTDVSTSVEQVKVYLSGALVTRNKTITLEKGKTELSFNELSKWMDPNTIQISTSGGIEILSIVAEKDFLSPQKINPRLKTLKDSLDLVNSAIQLLTDELNAYESERSMLLQNQNLAGKQNSIPVAELQKTADFFLQRVFSINKEVTELKKKKSKLSIRSTALQNQLNALNFSANAERKKVIVLVEATNTTKATFTLSYVVGKAGWQPNYDIVADKVGAPITIKYKAKAFNNTGNDWKDVSLILSSADPYLSAAKPVLTPHFLNSFSSTKDYKKKVVEQANNARFQQMQGNYMGSEQLLQQTGIQYKQILVSEFNVEYPIEKPYSVPSDAKPYIIKIKEEKAEAIYEHLSIPVIEWDAFLIAKVPNVDELEIIEGPANVYFENKFVGKSELSAIAFEDTLAVSLGKDKKVVVRRETKKDFTSKTLIGNNVKRTYAYEIKVKNTHSNPIRLTILDQIPVSLTDKISVNADETSGSTPNETTGEIIWIENLDAGGTSSYQLSYSIKYSKGGGGKVSTRKFRTISSPSF